MITAKNERLIQPIATWVNGQAKTLEVLRLDNYFQYDFLMCPGRVHYCLCEVVTVTDTDENGNTTTREEARSIIDGNVDLTWDLVNDWGEDDDIIFEYVLNELNLQQI